MTQIFRKGHIHMTKKQIENFLKRIRAKNAEMEIISWEHILHRTLEPFERYFVRQDWLNDDSANFFPDVFSSVS